MGSTSFPGALDAFTTDYSSSSPGRQVGPDVDDHSAALNAVETRLLNTSNVYNITHPSYGAVAGQDSTTAVQAAIDACATAGGGIVYVPPATSGYMISQITLKTKVCLRGAGMGSRLTSIASNANAYMIVLDSISETDVWITDLMLYGNKGAQTTNGGILFDHTGYGPGDQRHRFENLYIVQFKNNGLSLIGDLRSSWVTNCYCVGCDGHSFYHTGQDNLIEGCQFGNSGLSGLVDDGSNNRILGCKSFYAGKVDASTNGDGYQLLGQGTFVSNCEAQDCGRYGFNLDTCTKSYLEGVTVDGGDGTSYRLNNATDNVIRGFAPGLTPRTGPPVNVLVYAGTCTRNSISVRYASAALSGAATSGTSSSSVTDVGLIGS